MIEVRIVPIDEKMIVKRPDLAAAIASFLEANLPESPEADKAWAVYSQDSETIKILAFAGVNIGSRSADVPVFYVEPGNTRQSKWAAAKATEVLTSRMSGFIADSLGFGTQVFIRIEPQQEHIWEMFVSRLGAVKAERFMVEV